MPRFVTVSGVSGAGLLILGIAVPLVLPERLPDVARYALLGAGAVLILTSWVWWLLNGGSGGAEGGGTSQISQGSNSPNVAGVFHGPVNFNHPPAPAPVQDRKPARGWWQKSTEDTLLNRMIRENDEAAEKERLFKEELAKQESSIRAKAEMMRQRLATRHHSIPGAKDTYLAAIWDAELRGETYDDYHRSTFVLIGHPSPKGAPVEQWLRLHEALHYIVYESIWATKQASFALGNTDKAKETFDKLVASEVRERLARSEVAARGKLGTGNESLARATQPIPTEFWTDAFFQPYAEIVLAQDDRCVAATPGGDKGYRAIVLKREDVQKVWPARAGVASTPLSLVVEEVRAKIEAEKPFLPGATPKLDPQSVLKKMEDPYKEAVLQLEAVKITKSGVPGEDRIGRAEGHLHFVARAPLCQCMIKILSLEGPEVAHFDAYIRTGWKDKPRVPKKTFAILKGAKQPIAFLKRDLTDLVSNPPFLLLTDKGEYPLADNADYVLRLSLESEAKHPTLVTVRISTGVKDTISAELIEQTV